MPDFTSGSVVTIGNFDGVHLGHQRLLTQVKQLAKNTRLPSVLIIFEPTPIEFFLGQKAPARLMRLREKVLSLAAEIDYLLVLKFSPSLRDMRAEAFVSDILVSQLHTKTLIVGDDFRFGAKRAGDIALLKRLAPVYGYTLYDTPTNTLTQARISSTRIRACLQLGDMDMAKALLGKWYAMSGRVVHGQKIGRTLGFPTMNLNVHRMVVPLQGIFVVRVTGLEQAYYGVANLGTRPVFNGQRILLEVHLFDFDQTVYGCYVQVDFLHKLRDEQHFDTLEALKQAIHQDVCEAKIWLSIDPP